jgi:toxin-antitoxin system PIN domain toxin
MSVALLDLNVLIGLLDPAHLSHEDAHRWFAKNRQRGWATSPMTINGCVRVLSNSAYRTVDATPAEVIAHLDRFCGGTEHRFWEDSVTLIDPGVFRRELIGHHAKITDAYLLALAVRNSGRLATFDRSIPVKAVVGARPDHIELLGAARPL